MHKTVLPILIGLLASTVFCFSADTNAPAFRFHPELADMTDRIATPIVLTNSPLIGLQSGQVSNHFAQSFTWTTNGVATVTGFIKFPRHSDYIWHRCFVLSFTQDKVAKVEIIDRPGGCVIFKERTP